jgi:hypothetical protein
MPSSEPPVPDELAVMAELPVAPEMQRSLDNERAAVLAAQVGTFRLTREQQAALLVHATPELVEVRPTGECYVPGKFYRDVLNKVFGPGAWAVRHGTPMMDVQEKDWKSTLYLNVFLMAGRCSRCARSINACVCLGPVEQTCVGMAIGAQAYHPRNSRLSYDDALEAAITNGLMRVCAKQLGSYAECWEPRWAEATRAAVCVRVLVQERNDRVWRWRRIDRAPLDGETSPPQARPVPVPEPVAPSAPPAAGEAIGQIRRSETSTGKPFWTVVTDRAEHLTDDEHFVRQLEGYKAQGKRIIFDDELVPTRGGVPKKKIVEFRIAD